MRFSQSVGMMLLMMVAAFGAAVGGTRFGGLLVQQFKPKEPDRPLILRGCEVAELQGRAEATFNDHMGPERRDQFEVHIDVATPLDKPRMETDESIVVFFSVPNQFGGGLELYYDDYSCDLISFNRSR